MTQLTLYHATPTRSAVALWMLEEIGEPYDIKLLDISRGEQRTPDYLAINPMGKVPALKHGDAVITEAAAICTYLADAFPQAGLTVPIGDPRRGIFLKWLFYAPSVIEPAQTDRAFPRKEEVRRSVLGHGDFDTVIEVLANAVKPGPFLLGDQFTAADLVIGANIRWGMSFKLMPQKTEFLDYVARFEDRPALKRAEAMDAEFAARKAG